MQKDFLSIHDLTQYEFHELLDLTREIKDNPDKYHKKLKNQVYSVPEDIDKKVALLKLKSMGIKIDKLTPEQVKYLSSWQEGT